jgi:Fe-S-cluster containining protein
MTWTCQRCGKCCAAFPIVPVLAEEVERIGEPNVERNEVGACQMVFLTRPWSPVGTQCCIYLGPDHCCAIYEHRPAACRRWTCAEPILTRTLDLELANRAARESNYAPEAIAHQVAVTAAYLEEFRRTRRQLTLAEAHDSLQEHVAKAVAAVDDRPIWEVVAALGREISDEEWDRFPPASVVRKRELDTLRQEIATLRTRNEILLRRFAHKQAQPPDESWQEELDRALARVADLKRAVKVATVTMASVWPEDFRAAFNDAELMTMVADTKPATEADDFAVEAAMRAALFPEEDQ